MYNLLDPLAPQGVFFASFCRREILDFSRFPNGYRLVIYVCFLTRSFSVQQPLEGLLRAEATEGHVAPAAVIEPEIAGQPAVPLY
jgi:hypothetical protein